MSQRRPVVLVVLDGWGCHKDIAHNAIAAAHKPTWDDWIAHYPHIALDASGTAVGLPSGQMGNSEVGHTHIGAGRVVYQEFTRINEAIHTKEFAKKAVLVELIQQLKKSKKALHVMGLLSEGGVHSHQNHLFTFLQVCQENQFHEVWLHLFLDGRDCPPQSALASISALNAQLTAFPVAKIASITGRYYAMDRNHRWERIEPVYQLLTESISPYHFESAEAAIESFYAKNITDEFIFPTLIGASHPIQSGDALFFFNFRADRARQLTQAFLDEDFPYFERPHKPILSQFVSMTHYADNLPTTAVFSPASLDNVLGEVIAKQGLKQLRIAETEKYAHVTFFFNGGRETPFPLEDRILVPSPKVATYDLLPEMSAPLITKQLVDVIKKDIYDVVICNYANADMVGHSGNFPAAVKAIECIDRCLHDLGEAIAAQGGYLLITADHGNAEIMFDPITNQPHTAHTSERVPFLFIGKGWHCSGVAGSLVDIAPTVLSLLGIKVPLEMTGHSLLMEDNGGNALESN
jgi:2,3-bisphosphoglycerate-independent phosphoglycerate mutase